VSQFTRALFPLALVLTFTACAVAQGQAVVVLPGQGKDPSLFQQDAEVCRQFAVVQHNGDEYAYDQCMAARGNIVESPPADYVPPPYAYAYPYPFGYPEAVLGGGLFAGFAFGPRFHNRFFHHDHFAHGGLHNGHFGHGGFHHGGGHR